MSFTRINTNISALNAARNLGINSNRLDKSLERLSSGLRINRAGDDAAGLYISEKLRNQIRGLNQAVSNAQDGISLIQTAEGALNEVHNILQRMRELAVQASNDTLTSEDRSALQDEVTALISEVDRISNTTEFNTRNLLDGSSGVGVSILDASVASASATADTAEGDLVIDEMTLATAATAETVDGSAVDLTAATALGNASTITINGTSFSFAGTATIQDVEDSINGAAGQTGVAASFDAVNDKIVFTQATVGSSHEIVISNTSGEFKSGEGNDYLTINEGTSAGTDATVVDNNADADITTYTAAGNVIEVTSGNFEGLKFTAVSAIADDSDVTVLTVNTNNALSLQVGANAGQTLSVSINTINAASLSIASLQVTSQATAAAAITTIDNGVSTVSDQRSGLGAIQNRLESTIANLGVTAENLTAADSRIRDADIAAETTEYTRNQILVQAATSILAQANMAPQSVLSLLG
jgi:flagellin